MEPITYIDRTTGKIHKEKVYGNAILKLLYGGGFFGTFLKFLTSHFSLCSALFGWWHKLPFTKRKIRPFIKRFAIDTSEFLEPIENFHSFNDFFIRQLKPEVRPIVGDSKTAIIPADGRYLFFQNIALTDGFLVKGEKFHLEMLLLNEELASRYQHGAMVIARLCPSDYHRYHFPVDCSPGESHLIHGRLFSVNPMAIKKDIHIFSKNKRTICELETKQFGKVLYLEIGATNVGSINQTYEPHSSYRKGAEKGFFSFGASTIILLFEPESITFDQDLLEASSKKIEIKCLVGQSMGKYFSSAANF
ncbi:MAG: Phosphatidylserine decarboxylase proenzyme [Chlamydiae bacterium]|nr:Phosphatidylserine decarboxylase proenzyme [Chlamydiota bacterium]